MEKLQAQKEYLEAEENGDLERMRQIAIKFGSALGKMSREPPPPCKGTQWVAVRVKSAELCYRLALIPMSLSFPDVTPATFETPEVHTGTGMVGNKPRSRGRGLEEGQ